MNCKVKTSISTKIPIHKIGFFVPHGSTLLELTNKLAKKQVYNISMIRKVREGYRVVAESGRNMGTYSTKEAAEKRLRQIEMFKHMKRK